jgi:hypothetical protein
MADLGNKYYVGELIEITLTVADSDGNATDPTTAKIYYKDPSSNITELLYDSDGISSDMTHPSAGTFGTKIDGDESGNWYYRGITTGTAQGACAGRFHVRELNIST